MIYWSGRQTKRINPERWLMDEFELANQPRKNERIWMKWILSDRQTGLEWMNLNLVIDKINLITVIIFKTSKQQMNPSNQSTATNEFRFGARIHLVDWLDSLLACFLYVNLLAGGLNQTNLILNFSKSISIKLLTPAIEFWFISEFRLNLVWCPPFQPQLVSIQFPLMMAGNWS